MALTKTSHNCWFPFKAHIICGKVGLKTEILWTNSKYEMGITPYFRSWEFKPHIYFPLCVFLNTEIKELYRPESWGWELKIMTSPMLFMSPFSSPWHWYSRQSLVICCTISIKIICSFMSRIAPNLHLWQSKDCTWDFTEVSMSRRLKQRFQTQIPKGGIKASGFLCYISQVII